jgi:class 3 adenylate cyclase
VLAMKLFSFRSTQSRLSLLIGLFTLLAAINAVLITVQAANLNQQMADLRDTADDMLKLDEARISLLKQQNAIKQSALDVSYDQAQSDILRYGIALRNYIELQNGKSDDPTQQELIQAYDIYTAQSQELMANLYDDQGYFNEQAYDQIESLDLAAADLEQAIQERISNNTSDFRTIQAVVQYDIQLGTQIGQVGLLVLCALVIWGVFITFNITDPIRSLTGSIVAFENRVFLPQLLEKQTRRKDDLGKLSLAVSNMAQSISEQNRMTEQFLEAAQRFVPVQYLDFLQKDDITKVHLGDHVSAEMAVMFSDIRGFTTMSEGMTAQENFDFINEYLQLVSPIIQQNEGFIVKFLGDGMMAIFPYGVNDAVKAGIEKARAVNAFNQALKQRGMGCISVGIGIHTGPMMVGMIGEEMRMQGDAFSDNVNLTSRIEGLNKYFGTSMIISAESLAQLELAQRSHLRYLGKVVVKGRSEPLGLYEIYGGLPSEDVARKDSLKSQFEQGVALFARASFHEAGEYFNRVLEQDSSDQASRVYLEQCADLVDRERPAGWDGSIVMNSK